MFKDVNNIAKKGFSNLSFEIGRSHHSWIKILVTHTKYRWCKKLGCIFIYELQCNYKLYSNYIRAE